MPPLWPFRAPTAYHHRLLVLPSSSALEPLRCSPPQDSPVYGASTASYPSTAAPGTPVTGLLLCFHNWRGPFSVPSSSGQYSSKRILLSPSGLRSISSSWSRIENCAALRLSGLIDHSASVRSQLSLPPLVWREMSTRQTGAVSGGGLGESGSGAGGSEGGDGGGDGDCGGDGGPGGGGACCGDHDHANVLIVMLCPPPLPTRYRNSRSFPPNEGSGGGGAGLGGGGG